MIVVNSRYFSVQDNNLERTLSPKVERSRDKWRQHLVRFQYETGMSQQEMDDYLNQMAQNKITATDPQENKSTTVYNSADFVLAYLTPKKKK